MTLPEALAILGLTELPDADGLRRAYKRAAPAAHPDTGGSRDAFQELQNASMKVAAAISAKHNSRGRKCQRCSGTGKVRLFNGISGVQKRCPDCSGKGK